MEQDLELQRLINELKQSTGIQFSIAKECDEGWDTTVAMLRQLVRAYKSQHNRDYFLRGILLGEISQAQMQQDARRFQLDIRNHFWVFYIEICQSYDIDIEIILKNLFSPKTMTFVISIDTTHLVLLKVVNKQYSKDDVKESAHMIVDMLNVEAMLDVRVAYGALAEGLERLQTSYGEAMCALEVGRIFYIKERVFDYERLGIGRLIYALPISACKAYVYEIFGESIPEELDVEMRATISVFFDNGLNISETAKELYVHRNTLVYRLEKLYKSIGLDIRNFDDAMTYKVVAMIMEYIRYTEQLKE